MTRVETLYVCHPCGETRMHRDRPGRVPKRKRRLRCVRCGSATTHYIARRPLTGRYRDD